MSYIPRREVNYFIKDNIRVEIIIEEVRTFRINHISVKGDDENDSVTKEILPLMGDKEELFSYLHKNGFAGHAGFEELILY